MLKFTCDAFVFFAGQVAGDGAVHDAPSQATTFVFQFGGAGLGPSEFGSGAPALLVEFGAQAVADAVLEVIGQGNVR